MSQPSDDHRFLNGPRFVEWLFEIRPDLEGRVNAILGSSLQRRIFDWKKGAFPDAFGVPDQVCTKLDLHLDDIPDDIWLVDRPRVKGRRLPWEQRRAIELLDEGYFPAEVAAQLNVAVTTVRTWQRKAAA